MVVEDSHPCSQFTEAVKSDPMVLPPNVTRRSGKRRRKRRPSRGEGAQSTGPARHRACTRCGSSRHNAATCDSGNVHRQLQQVRFGLTALHGCMIIVNLFLTAAGDTRVQVMAASVLGRDDQHAMRKGGMTRLQVR